LREQLLRYFTAFLALGGDDDAAWKLALLELAPTPMMAAHLPRAKVARILKEHRVRCHDASAVLAVLRSPPLAGSEATTAAASAHVLSLLKSIRLAVEQVREANAMLDRLTDRLAEPEENAPRQIVRDYHALRCHTGIAPVTKQSGKSRRVVRRHACNRRLQNAVYHWARVAIQHDPASRFKYDALRARGHSWARALRGVADRLLYVLCAMLRAGTLYEVNHVTASTRFA
jgi:hypothetical protein